MEPDLIATCEMTVRRPGSPLLAERINETAQNSGGRLQLEFPRRGGIERQPAVAFYVDLGPGMGMVFMHLKAV